MNFHKAMQKFLLSSVITFSLPLAMPILSEAKPPINRSSPPPTPESINYRHREKAERELSKAQEKAYELEYLAGGEVSSPDATKLVAMGDRILTQARQAYSSGQYFQATEQALAAKDTYEAAKSLYTGQLPYASNPVPKGALGLTPSYFDAPYKAQEELTRAEAEMSYYQVNSTINNTLIGDLINRAKHLSSVSQSTSNPNNVAYLANNRAASPAS